MPNKSMNSLTRVALSGIFLFLFSACENDIKDVKALTEKKISVETGIDIVAYYSQHAKVKSKLTAPLMKRYQSDSPYYEFPRSIHVDFYNDSTIIESQVSARYAKYKENERKVYLRDSVVVFNIKGDTLHCEELWWDQQKQIFYTDKPVRIHRPNHTILYGIGLQAAQNFSWFNTTQANGPVELPKEFNNDLK
jgi:LPS export ABC transporter protein LptC